MSFNGSGTFSLPESPFVPNTPISSSAVNSDLSSIATDGLSQVICKDGQTTITGALKGATGSQGLPSYSFSADLDSGMWRIGANNIGIGVNATKILDIGVGGLTAVYAAHTINYAAIQQAAAHTIIGNPTAGTANLSEMTLGAGLSFSGTTLGVGGLVPPQGRLTLTSNTPVISADVTAATTVFYTPYIGTNIPIFDGTSIILTTFAELSMAMSGANFAANAIYDLFVINDTGTIRLGIGPVWSTLTAGSGARGTGAGTTELERLNGFWTNKNTITIRYASGSTVSVGVHQATYVGSMFMDATNSQVTCHVSYGQSRKFGIWNAYNRVPIVLKAGDSTGSWGYNSATIRASNGDANNKLTAFCGLPEENYDFQFVQKLALTVASTTGEIQNGIGVNSTTAFSGEVGGYGLGGAGVTVSGSGRGVAHHFLPPAIGVNNIQACEAVPDVGGTEAISGTEALMYLTGTWRG